MPRKRVSDGTKKAEFIDLVKRWLDVENIKHQTILDDGADFHVNVWIGESGASILFYKNKDDSICCICNIALNPPNDKAFAALKDQNQKDTLRQALKESLLNFDVSYRYVPNFDQLQFVEISKIVWFDAPLTKQRFFDTLNLLLRAGVRVNLDINKHLQYRGKGNLPA